MIMSMSMIKLTIIIISSSSSSIITIIIIIISSSSSMTDPKRENRLTIGSSEDRATSF